MQLELSKVLIVVFGSLMAGFMGGQVGGAGLITLPILLFIGMDPLLAFGTNRFAAIFLNLTGALTFYKHHKIAWKHYVVFAVIALIGGIGGALILFLFPIDQVLLKKILIGVIFLMMLVVFFKKNMGLKEGNFQMKKKHYLLLLLGIFGISIYGGVFAVAMTTMYTILFTMNRQSYVQSMGHALFLSTVVAVVSATIFIYHNSIDYPYAILQTVSASTGAYFGSKYALLKGNVWLRNLIFIAMVLVLMKLCFDVF